MPPEITTPVVYPESFDHWFRVRCEIIRKNHALALEDNEVEGYHQLRVEIKRIRAYFNLIGALNRRFRAKKYLQPFRKIFKAAGPVRDAQVQLALVHKMEKAHKVKFPEFRDFMRQKETASIVSFHAFCREFHIEALEQTAMPLLQVLQAIPPEKALQRALKRKSDLLNSLLEMHKGRKQTTVDLHRIRILSKEARYTLEIMQTCFPDSDQQKELIKGMKGLQQPLGDWHDLEVCQEYLNFLRGEACFRKTFNTDLYKNFSAVVRAEKDGLRQQFNERWEQFCLAFQRPHAT